MPNMPPLSGHTFKIDKDVRKVCLIYDEDHHQLLHPIRMPVIQVTVHNNADGPEEEEMLELI